MACIRLAAVQQQQLVGYKGRAAPCCPQHPAVATCHLQLQQQQQAVCFPQQRRPPTCLLPRRSTPRLPPLPTCPPPPLASTTCPLPRRVTRCPACLPTRHQGCLCQAWHHPCPASQSSSSSRHCRWRWCCRAVRSPVGNGCGSWNGSSTAVPLACWLVGTAPTAAQGTNACGASRDLAKFEWGRPSSRAVGVACCGRVPEGPCSAASPAETAGCRRVLVDIRPGCAALCPFVYECVEVSAAS